MGKRRADWCLYPKASPAIHQPPWGVDIPGGPRRGAPGGPGGPRGCTFWRVFNNSPSRDKMKFRIFRIFGTEWGIWGVYGVWGVDNGGGGDPPRKSLKGIRKEAENPQKGQKPPKSRKPPKMAKMAKIGSRAPRAAPARGEISRPGPGGPPGGAPRGGPREGGFWAPRTPLRLGEFLCPCDQVSRTIRIAETCEETGDKETRSIATSDCRSLRESEARRVNPKEGENNRVRGTIVTAIAARTHGGGSDSRHPPGVRLPGQTTEGRTQVELAQPELSDSLRRAP